MANTVCFHAVGRRKKAIARVRLLPGEGKMCIRDSFGSLEAIAQTKYELIQTLPEAGAAFFGSDGGFGDRLYALCKKEKYRAGVGSEPPCFMEAGHVETGVRGTRFELVCADGEHAWMQTPLLGSFSVRNIALAAAVARKLGLSMEEIARGVEKLKPLRHRLQLVPGELNVIDDSLNALPEGAEEALRVLAEFPGRRILVTAGLAGLGADAGDRNFAFGTQIAGCADYVVLVGPESTREVMRGLMSARYPKSSVRMVREDADAAALVKELAGKGDSVLYLSLIHIYIYCFFSLDTPFYRAMRERGYLAELQGESARRLADAVCEGIQTECYDADHVLRAIPVSAIIGERLAANTSLWERLNLGAYPQTWDQMFDFIENWCRNSEMNSQYALMGYTSAEETRNMIGYILRADYDTYRQSFEEPIKYSTEIYQRLLHRLQTLPLDDLEYDVEYEYDHILLSDLYLPSPVGGGFIDPSMSCLQLSVDGTVPTPALAVVYYLCVNPSSENLERAMELVNFFAENIPLENRATLCPDFDTPIASDELEQRKAAYDEQLEALAIRYGETNDRAEQTALQLEMEQLSRDFQYYIQNNAYLVDQNSLERYHRDIQNGLVVDYGEGVLDADTLGKLSDKHEMFIAGMLTVEQYTEVLDLSLIHI